MVTEAAMGILTAAGSALLPFFLIKQTGAAGPGAIGEVITLLGVVGTPFAVASAEHGIAMQSRYYTVEAWPTQLAGLGTQGAVLGLFYLLGGFPQGGNSSIFQALSTSEIALLVGTVGIVPIAEMIVLNLTKTPRSQVPFGGFGAVRYTPEGGLQVAAPSPQPLFAPARGNALDGMLVPVASGRF